MSEILVVPHTELMHREREAKTAETLALVRGIGNALNTPSESGAQPTVTEVLGRAVTDAMITRAIDIRTGFMGVYHDPVSDRRFRFTDSDKETDKVRQFVAREKAREVLANGLLVAENLQDIETWHQLMSHADFLDFGKSPIGSERVPPLPIPQASQVIEAIGRIGRDDKHYIESMAVKWLGIYSKGGTGKQPVELDDLATHMLQRARNQLDGASVDFRLRDLAGEFGFGVAAPDKFFAAELHRLTDQAYALPQTPHAVLTAVKSRPLNAKKQWYYKGLADYAEVMLGRGDMLDATSKNPDVYRDSGYALLHKMLEFSGQKFPGAKVMAQGMTPTRDRERSARVASQTARIIAIANNPGLREYIGRHTGQDSSRLATIPSVIVKTEYDAVDRLLLALEGRVGETDMTKESKEMLAQAARCVRVVLKFGDQRAAQTLKRAV